MKDELSPRELQALERLVKGESCIKIGMELGIQDSCVRHHIQRARKKLHATSRVQLAIKALPILTKPKTPEES